MTGEESGREHLQTCFIFYPSENGTTAGLFWYFSYFNRNVLRKNWLKKYFPFQRIFRRKSYGFNCFLIDFGPQSESFACSLYIYIVYVVQYFMIDILTSSKADREFLWLALMGGWPKQTKTENIKKNIVMYWRTSDFYLFSIV